MPVREAISRWVVLAVVNRDGLVPWHSSSTFPSPPSRKGPGACSQGWPRRVIATVKRCDSAASTRKGTPRLEYDCQGTRRIRLCLIITLSTPSLRSVAGANRDAKVPRLQDGEGDPVASGVGISRRPEEAPPYMVGLEYAAGADAAGWLMPSPKLARVESPGTSEANRKPAWCSNHLQNLGIELIKRTSTIRPASARPLPWSAVVLMRSGSVATAGCLLGLP